MLKMKSLVALSLIAITSMFSSILYANVSPNIAKVNDAVMVKDTLYMATEEHGVVYSTSDLDYSKYTKSASIYSYEASKTYSIRPITRWQNHVGWKSHNTENSYMFSNKILKITHDNAGSGPVYFLSEGGFSYIHEDGFVNLVITDTHPEIFTDNWVNRVSAITSLSNCSYIEYCLFIELDNVIYGYSKEANRHPHPGIFKDATWRHLIELPHNTGIAVNTLHVYRENPLDKKDIRILIGTNQGLISLYDPLHSVHISRFSRLTNLYRSYQSKYFIHGTYGEIYDIERYDNQVYLATDIGILIYNGSNFKKELKLLEGIPFIHYYMAGTNDLNDMKISYTSFASILPYTDTKGYKHVIFGMKNTPVPEWQTNNQIYDLRNNVFSKHNRGVHYDGYSFAKKESPDILLDKRWKNIFNAQETIERSDSYGVFDVKKRFPYDSPIVGLFSDSSKRIFVVTKDGPVILPKEVIPIVEDSEL